MYFNDIPGNSAVKRKLIRSVKEERISHAQLFSGKDGYCSLQLAVAFAQYINCKDKREDDSCGLCSSCVKAAKLIHPDIHFVFPVIKEGAVEVSDDKLDEWREMVLNNLCFDLYGWFEHISAGKKSGLISVKESKRIYDKLSLKTFEGSYKVMIIWHPERMNESASNKLLKILEEPPGNTLFLLVTDSVNLLLPTIISRTQQTVVGKIEKEAVSRALLKEYELSDEESLNTVRLSGGDYLTAREILSNSGQRSEFFDLFAMLMRSAYARKIFDISAWVETVAPFSRDKIKSFFDYAVDMVRESAIYQTGKTELRYLSTNEELFVKKFSLFIDFEIAQKMADQFHLAYDHIGQNGNAKIVLFDMAVKLIICFKN
ncbi:DNA polymerase III subunit delta [Marinilabiliaceae bacterium ANBcel2]|nr:DNA polymerase III subunit delta [Marinilabiliaceae bacterium ANBcel2]